MTRKRVIIVGVITAVVIGVAGVVFDACNKDELNTQDGKRMGSIGDSIIIEDIIIPVEFSTIDFSRIGQENGTLVFESIEHYGQTIDALLEICNQYSNNYRTVLEARLGCSIEDANEEVVDAYITGTNFFQFNPLMQFIEQIGFTNSAYPVLRVQEIEWLATSFETAENPFDAVGAGYVQSALHNTGGCVKICDCIVGYNMEDCGDGKKQKSGSWCFTSDPDDECDSRDVKYKDKDFDGNKRLKGKIATSTINVHGKTGVYKKGTKNWSLWTKRVDIVISGRKWLQCDPYNPQEVLFNKDNTSWTGLTEKYHTFWNTPTYIARTGYTTITGIHRCKDSKNGTIIASTITEIQR